MVKFLVSNVVLFVVVALINLGLLALAIWVVVSVLRWLNVLA